MSGIRESDEGVDDRHARRRQVLTYAMLIVLILVVAWFLFAVAASYRP